MQSVTLLLVSLISSLVSGGADGAITCSTNSAPGLTSSGGADGLGNSDALLPMMDNFLPREEAGA